MFSESDKTIVSEYQKSTDQMELALEAEESSNESDPIKVDSEDEEPTPIHKGIHISDSPGRERKRKFDDKVGERQGEQKKNKGKEKQTECPNEKEKEAIKSLREVNEAGPSYRKNTRPQRVAERRSNRIQASGSSPGYDGKKSRKKNLENIINLDSDDGFEEETSEEASSEEESIRWLLYPRIFIY